MWPDQNRYQLPVDLDALYQRCKIDFLWFGEPVGNERRIYFRRGELHNLQTLR
jgi:hypothetical protein